MLNAPCPPCKDGQPHRAHQDIDPLTEHPGPPAEDRPGQECDEDLQGERHPR